MMNSNSTRRQFIRTFTVVTAGLLLAGCRSRAGTNLQTKAKDESPAKPDENQMGGEVTATEDLMREHGVLRRALLVYSAAAIKLRSSPAAVAPDALQKTAKLFRAFGEEYHEKKLEETHIFPALKNANSPAAAYVGLLTAQHQ